jgi:ketosteroid isomerase-like protein
VSQENVEVAKAAYAAWNAGDMDAFRELFEAADHVVVRQIWRGAGYGPESNMEMTNVMTVRKGRIFFQEFFWDHAEALEAIGLSE